MAPSTSSLQPDWIPPKKFTRTPQQLNRALSLHPKMWSGAILIRVWMRRILTDATDVNAQGKKFRARRKRHEKPLERNTPRGDGGRLRTCRAETNSKRRLHEITLARLSAQPWLTLFRDESCRKGNVRSREHIFLAGGTVRLARFAY